MGKVPSRGDKLERVPQNEAVLRTDPLSVALIPATPAHLPLLSNLLQLYVYDFSEIIPLEPGTDGRFETPDPARYFSEPSHVPFLATAGGRWAGFVFIRQMRSEADGSPIWDMAEFFVLRGSRRHGIGTALAHAAFQRFAGAWQVRVMEANTAAALFWRRAIESFTGAAPVPETAAINGVPWLIFRFESVPGRLAVPPA